MTKITLYSKDNVTVILHRFFFDPEIKGIQAELEVQNCKDITIDVLVVDLWDGKHFFDDNTIISHILPNTTVRKTLIEITGTDEEECILLFQQGYLPSFSFRIAVYAHSSNTDIFEFCGKGNKITISKFSMNGVSVETDEHFNITYVGDTLFAATKYYIPFEINKNNAEKSKQIHAFKKELSNRIEMTDLCSDTVLVAQYGELGKPRFYDIENMCIYNLGTSTFSQCSPSEIAFMELSEQEITSYRNSLHETSDYKFYYAYTPFGHKELETLCQAKTILAKWEEIYIDTSIPNTPLRYWKSIRKQFEKIKIHTLSSTSTHNAYGLRLTLHMPKKVLPASIMKSLLDGVICAFHKRKNDDFLKRIIGNYFNYFVAIPEESISLLGKQDYLKSYRANSIKWNPADERLKFAWISVIEEDCLPHFDGTLFLW